MGAREEIRLLNLQGHAPKLGQDMAGTTSGWGLEWDNSNQWFVPTDLAGTTDAPVDATYITLTLNSTLAQERVLTVDTAGLTQIDGGPNAALTHALWWSGQAHGDVIYRNSTNWALLPAGTTGQALITGGAAADPFWGDVAPLGAAYVLVGAADPALTSERLLRAGTGLTLQDGGAGAAVTLEWWYPSEARGDVAFRGASEWERLPAGSSGQHLATQGVGADPIWQTPSTGAPVDALYVTLGLDGTLAQERVLTVDTAGLTQIDGGANAAVTHALWFASQAQGDVIYRGSGSWARLPAGTSGQRLTTKGVGQNPTWETGPPVDASYVTLSLHADLAEERVLTVDPAGLTQIDNGPNAAVQHALWFAGQTHGDIIYRDTADWARLTAGTSGQLLQTQGPNEDPKWGSFNGMPAASTVGQVLYSTDGSAFTAEKPVTSEDGWLVNESGLLIVEGT